MSKRGHHRTTDKVLERSLLWLEGLSIVDRVVIHRVENCRHKYSPELIHRVNMSIKTRTATSKNSVYWNLSRLRKILE